MVSLFLILNVFYGYRFPKLAALDFLFTADPPLLYASITTLLVLPKRITECVQKKKLKFSTSS